MLTQMQRWGQIKGDVDYQKIARDVFLATDARRAMEQAGLVAPTTNTKTITVMGKVFDSSKPKEYLDSFAIKKV
jgi:nitrate/nitrite transport system substrate-binding protein